MSSSRTHTSASSRKPHAAGTSADRALEDSIQEIDSLFQAGGLVRNLRGKAAGVTRRMRAERLSPEDLRQPAPVPSVASNGVRWLEISAWNKPAMRSAIWHGFSTRAGGLSACYGAEGAPGELNLGFTASDERQTVGANRRLLIEAVTGDPATPLVTLRQIHSSVLVLGSSECSSRSVPSKGDGLVTDEPGVLLGVQTADCIPVLVADPKRRVVAAFHAGWRGTVKRIVEAGVGRMRLQFGCRPEDLTAAIGPGVGACCYAVGEEVRSSFESQFRYAEELFYEVYDSDPVRTKYPMLFLTQRAPGHSPIGPSLHVDLVEANRRQLLDAGLGEQAIYSTGGCTSCHRELFFSHRASQGHAGRMMSVIGIRSR
jgi:polyphenol oxidase